MEEEEAFWVEYVKDHIPRAYDGMKEILWKHKEQGGLICVVSHSFKHYILRDYEANGLPKPDRVFGWELAEWKYPFDIGKQKPIFKYPEE